MKKVIFAIFLFSGFYLHAIQMHDWHAYLVKQCSEVGVPVGIMEAILLQENPSFNPKATHKNKNGSVDLGLFQLNDKYIHTDFIPRYWHHEEEFRWDNPFHSTYVAVRHVKWLYSKFWQEATPRSKDFAVSLAYNCWYTAVMTGKVPRSSADYAAAVVFSVWGE